MVQENKSTEKEMVLLTTIEAIDIDKLIQEKKNQRDEKDTFLTCVIEKSTAEYMYDLIDRDFDNNLNDFDKLIDIVDKMKDLGYNEMAGDRLKWIEENFEDAWRNYRLESKPDYSSADGKDV